MGVRTLVIGLVSSLFVAAGGCGGGPTPVKGGAPIGGSNVVDIVNGCAAGGTTGAGSSRQDTSQPRGFLPPILGATTVAPVAPPAISGGTLRVLSDGKTVVAADPDRDQIYIADLTARTLKATVALEPGDEPGRVVEDGAGQVHVALRRGGAIVTLDPATGSLTARRPVCAAPRGLAYEPLNDRLHVACAGGELVTLPAAGGAPLRTLLLDRDLRDVVVDGGQLRVSRFRSAELLTVDALGATRRFTPPAFRSQATRGGQLYTSSAAWQTIAVPSGGALMLHQRGVVDQVETTAGGYSGVDACSAIVHSVVSFLDRDGTVQSGPALPGLVLTVDLALSPDGQRVAIVAAGNSMNRAPVGPAKQLPQVFVTSLQAAIDEAAGCLPDGVAGPCIPLPSGETRCTIDPSVPPVIGQPVAVAYAGDGSLIVQSREPAALSMLGGTITLSDESVDDTGHQVFHANAGGFIACASCHNEGDDDGRTWDFKCVGTRRTQSLQVGLRGTDPFHWSGDAKDFTQLMTDVYVTRMSGPVLEADQIEALLGWLDNQPRPPRAAPRDATAVARGRALFEDANGANCASCHAGPRFSNNHTENVGTGGPFQVPSLLGLGTRGPYMHNGCARTLKDRFSNPDCGGKNHGATAQLTAAQIDDLIAYLDSL